MREFTLKELEEIEVTDWCGEVIPRTIKQKLGMLRFFDWTFGEKSFLTREGGIQNEIIDEKRNR